MPFSLGFWAAAGAGSSGGGPAFEQISTTILGSTTTTVTFSSIPSTYRHLELRITARVNANFPNSTTARIRFNGEGGLATGYTYHNLYGNGSSVVSDAVTSQSGIFVNGFSDANITGNWGAGVISILDYSQTTKNKTTRALSGTANGASYNRIYLGSGLWNNTNAVTQIELSEPNGYGWLAGSRFTLYGIRG